MVNQDNNSMQARKAPRWPWIVLVVLLAAGTAAAFTDFSALQHSLAETLGSMTGEATH